MFGSQIRLITPAPPIAASHRGAAGGKVSTGVTQVVGEAGPWTTTPKTWSTGRTKKHRSMPNVTPVIGSDVATIGCGVSGAGTVKAGGSSDGVALDRSYT